MGTSRRFRFGRVVTAILVVMSAQLIGGGIVGAQTLATCEGDFVLDLESLGVRLLNAPGERSFGPIPIELAPGVYTVTAASWDGHDGAQVTQPQEEWQVVADTGWASPFTIDIPDDQQVSVSNFNAVEIGQQIASITLEHRGAGGVNSVTPLCVGFTLVDTSGPDAPPEDDTSIGDPISPDPIPDDGDDDDPSPVDDSDRTDPDDLTDPSDTAEPDDGDTAAPVGDEDDGIDTVVEGEVEITPSLARTGATPLTSRGLGLALVLIGMGGLAVLRSRRSDWRFD